MNINININNEISVCILAGGKSSRMGFDKAFLTVKNGTLLSHIYEQFKKYKVFISIADKEKVENLRGIDDAESITFIFDVHKGTGPIEGIYETLKKSSTEYVFFCATDMPYVNDEILYYLWEYMEKGEEDCVIVKTDRIQPLCGIYRKSVIPFIEEAIRTKKYRLRTILDSVKTKYIDVKNTKFEKCVKNLNSFSDFTDYFIESQNINTLEPDVLVETVTTTKVMADLKDVPSEENITCERVLDFVYDGHCIDYSITPTYVKYYIAGFLYLKEKEKLGLKSVNKTDYKKEDIFKLAAKLDEGSEIHKLTKGNHAVYLMYKGDIVFSVQDVARHNALTKAIGFIVLEGLDAKDCIIYSTGRAPVEIVKKVILADVPVFCAKAVPTKEGLSLAREYNLELICRAWPDSYEIYNKSF